MSASLPPSTTEDADVATGKAVLPYDLNDQDQLDLHPAYGTPARAVGSVPFWRRLLWEGGKPFDAFLTIVSAQVGFEWPAA